MKVSAYLERIGYEGSTEPSFETLRSLHRAHLFSVPFENLDIHIGREIVCNEGRILRKIIEERRGGFCYELNAAFAALLREVGFRVTLLSARVANDDGTFGPEFDHMTLRVDLEHPWLADVGFGESFLDPLLLEFGKEQPQGDGTYRVVPYRRSGSGDLAMEALVDGNWKPKYLFTLQSRELSDFAEMCRYHQTSSESHFTRRRICTLPTAEGRVTLSDRKLIETRSGERLETQLSSDEQWRAKLKERFGVVLPK